MKLSTRVNGLLAATVLLGGSLCLAGSDWPLQGEIELSSGFGDFRPGHFHFGVDLRTGGTIGRKVSSPVDGYVMRVRTSYYGYGKALYIKGDDGYIYVFGHLSEFATKIDQPLKAAQISAKRYYQDMDFLPDSIRVHKGEFIAYTGQSGSGGPHLHFEARDSENFPLNPLRCGFDLQDKTAPVFTRVGFQMVDDNSLFGTGERKMFFDVTSASKGAQYRLDTVLYFNRPFGIMADCYDQMKAGDRRQAVYKLSLYVDGELFYRVVFDSLDFATTAAVALEYDYVEATEGRKSVRALFKKTGNDYSGSEAAQSDRGILGSQGALHPMRIGLHQASIVAEDCFKNEAELTFEFLWGPSTDIFTLDSTITKKPDTTRFYFTPAKGYESLNVDSVQVYLNQGTDWGIPSRSRVMRQDDGRVIGEVIAASTRSAVLRLFVFAYHGCLIRDNLFNGIAERGAGKVAIEHEMLEDGLLVTVNSTNRGASEARLELYYRDTLLGIEYPRFFNLQKYICFIPPQRKYARIDLIKVAMSEDTAYDVGRSDSVNIVAVGFGPVEEIVVDEDFILHLGQDNFYQPHFLELHKNPIFRRSLLGLNSAYYQIYPKAFVCRKDFDITLRIATSNVANKRSGLCWLDEEANRWVWLDNNRFESNVLRAKSTGGGLFAAVFDLELPRIKYLSIADGKTYQSRQPAVNFVIEDTLSGIGDDESIIIKVDSEWLIPEYDPETGQCTSKPLQPLSPGRHHLGIMVTDRAGNLTEQYLNFYVKESGKKIGR
jgi:hypothetical protein